MSAPRDPELPESAPQPEPQPSGSLPGWSRQQPPPFTTPAAQPQAGGWQPPPPAPKPGIIPLRPLSIGDIMTGALEYVRADPKAVITISASIGVAAAFLQLLFVAVNTGDITTLLNADPNAITPEELLSALVPIFAVLVASGVLSGFLQVLGTGMLTHVVGRAVIGTRTSASEAWHLVRPQLWRLIAATILVGIVVFLGVLIPLLPGIVVLATGNIAVGASLTLIGSIPATVLAIWFTFGLVLSTPALALEDLSPIHALKRSWKLVKGAFWRTLVIVFIGSIVGQAVGSILASPFALVGASGEISTLTVFATAIAGMVTVLVALPFVAGVTALVYIDRRIRTEDLASKLAASAGLD